MPNTDTSKDSMDAIKQLEDQYLKDTLTDEEFTSEVTKLVLSDENLSNTLRDKAQKSGDTLENAIVKRFIRPMKASKALNKLQAQYLNGTLTDEALTSEVIKLVLSDENLSKTLRDKAQISGDTLENEIVKQFVVRMQTVRADRKKREEDARREISRAEAINKNIEEGIRRSSTFLPQLAAQPYVPNPSPTSKTKDPMDAIEQLEEQYLKDTLTDKEFTSEVIKLVLSNENLSKTLRDKAQESGETLENEIVKRFIEPIKTTKAIHKLQEQYYSDALTEEELTHRVKKLVLSNAILTENITETMTASDQKSDDNATSLENEIVELFIKPIKDAKPTCKKVEENGNRALSGAEAAHKKREEKRSLSGAFLPQSGTPSFQNSSAISRINRSAPLLNPLMLNPNPTISSSPSSKEIRPSFMMKALAGIALLGGIAMTIVGCLLVQPWVIAVGVAVTFGGAYGLGFFDSKPKVTVQNTLDNDFNLALT